jgi:RNA polymerase sigma-70 factor (ECF subfamily)
LDNAKQNIKPDKTLILKIKRGDHAAFKELYKRYFDRLYFFSLRYLKNKEETEGIVQEIFIKVWEIRNDLNPEKSFNSFLFTITKNAIFNKMKKRKHERTYAEYMKVFLDQHHNKTENDLIFAEVKDRIESVVKKLPAQRQKTYRLSREKGLSHKEIALKLNISPKTVEAHIRLALKSIRAVLGTEIILLIPLLIQLVG